MYIIQKVFHKVEALKVNLILINIKLKSIKSSPSL